RRARGRPGKERAPHACGAPPGGRLAFPTSPRFDRPPTTDVVDVPAHRVLRSLTDTRALVKKLAPVVEPPVEFLTVDIGGGVVLDGWMLKPSSFDRTHKYPVIVHVYGEPAGQTVTDRWGGGGMLFHRALAGGGYVVLTVAHRATPAPQGAGLRKT